MNFNLVIILSVLQFCEIIGRSTLLKKKGYCIFDDYEKRQLSCFDFTMTDLNGFTFSQIGSSAEININVTHLNLYDCHIDYFTRNFFGYFYGSLHVIKAKRCGISDIIDESFRIISHMNYLDLEDNAIKELRSKTFYNLRKLTYLDLSRNLIETIAPDTFQNLTLLQEIYLQKNKIKFITSDTFKMIKYIQILILSDNPINEELNLNINKIIILLASRCGITKFSLSVNFGEIDHLGLDENNLTEVCLAEVKVTKLYLSDNKIKLLDKIDGSKLRDLFLADNPLNYDNMQNSFDKMKNLELLYLCNTNLTNLNKDMFKSLSKLQSVYVDEKPFKKAEADDVIKEIPNLRNCNKIIDWDE